MNRRSVSAALVLFALAALPSSIGCSSCELSPTPNVDLSGQATPDLMTLDLAPPARDLSVVDLSVAALPALSDIWGSNKEDVWIAGAEGTLLHWDGGAWSRTASGTTAALGTIGGTSSSDVWTISSGGAALHWDGKGWSAAPNTPSGLAVVRASYSGDVWGLSYEAMTHDYGIVRWNGGKWISVLSGPTNYFFGGLGGTSASDMWFVGNGPIGRWNGTALGIDSFGNVTGPFYSVWARAPSDAWVVGDAGAIAHWNGTAWAKVPAPFAIYSGVWGASGADAWAVGRSCNMQNCIAHWDGTAWTLDTTLITLFPSVLTAVWGTSASDVWAIGSHWTGTATVGTIVHWDGATWREL